MSFYLSFADHLIPSASGVQHQDSLGHVLFALGIDDVTKVWYLDEACLEGPPDKMLAASRTMTEEFGYRGLTTAPNVSSDSSTIQLCIHGLLNYWHPLLYGSSSFISVMLCWNINY